MHHPFGLSSKKARLAVLFFTYGVMTISTIVLTVLAIYYAMGYRFNTDLGIEQGGVIEFRSEPVGAAITLDGQRIGRQTPNRTFAQAGEHTVAMHLNGYRDWSKKVALQPGQLLWLDYVRFIPQSITTSPTLAFANLSQALPSPDHKWLLLQELPTDAHLLLADVSDERSPTLVTLHIPDAVLTKKDGSRGTITLFAWDQGSRYILLQHTVGTYQEFIRLDRADPAAAVNLTTRFNLPISAAYFAAENSNTIVVKTGTALQRIDIGSAVVGAPFAEGVSQFSAYGDAVGFVAVRGSEQVVGVFSGGKEATLATAALDVPVLVAATEYARHTYLAYSVGGMAGVLVRDPASSNSAQVMFKLDPGIRWLAFSPKGRFVLGGSQSAGNGYDIETARSFAMPGGLGQAPQWLDDFHYYFEAGGMLRTAEFDGQNEQEITSVAPGFAAVLTPNERAIFSIAKNAQGNFSLQASGLVH